MLVKQCYVGKSFYNLLTVQIEKIHVIDTTNEKHNISNNINLILILTNVFFQAAAENL